VLVLEKIIKCLNTHHIPYKKIVVPGKDKNSLASNAATWQK
jgi:hypothetical protein